MAGARPAQVIRTAAPQATTALTSSRVMQPMQAATVMQPAPTVVQAPQVVTMQPSMMAAASRCPFLASQVQQAPAQEAKKDDDNKVPWTLGRPQYKPKEINLKILNPASYCNNYNYAEEFLSVDLNEVKQDLYNMMT